MGHHWGGGGGNLNDKQKSRKAERFQTCPEILAQWYLQNQFGIFEILNNKILIWGAISLTIDPNRMNISNTTPHTNRSQIFSNLSLIFFPTI